MVNLILLAAVTSPTIAPIEIDATKSKPISPYVYGVNHPDWKRLGPGITLARQGGNRMTAYNWETNASNAGNDWHHQNDGYVGKTDEPGWSVRTFLEEAQKHGAAALVTVPTAGYVSADKNEDGDVNKTPNYLEVRFHRSLPKKPGGKWVYPPNLKDRVVYQDEFVAFLEKRKASKTPLWYSLDNEPDLWASTHARIRPRNPGYAGIIANNIEFAQGIKSAAPKALVFGPANYGWQGFRTFQDAPDRNGRDFLDVYLAAMKAAQAKSGRRLLDVLDIHWYPEAQGGGVRIALANAKETEATFQARIQAPRSLWDPTYVESSWITRDSLQGKPIVLLPRVLRQIAAHYPGTKLAITEYNYGGGNHVSGLLAQADVLGIFGRYGIFAACNWGLSPADKAQVAGLNAFLKFSPSGRPFGDRALSVNGESAAENSVYAALDSKDRRRLTVIAINKTSAPMPFRLAIKGFKARSGSLRWTGEGALQNPQSGAAAFASGEIRFTAPPLSVCRIEARS